VVLDASPYYLGAVGAYYDYFNQVSDEEVIALMQSAAAGPGK
jgi:predicted phosphoribosyltransferase